MAMSKKQVQDWLKTIPGNATIGIDEGGLCLVATDTKDKQDYWLEVGGMPEENDEDENE